MQNRFSFALTATSLLVGLGGCVDPYLPNVADANTNLLVVDGFINGNGRTRIKLSRTTNVAATTTPPVEKSARLFIVDDAGTRYALTEQTSGSYRSDSLQLNPARQYQLRITTSANVTYTSDAVPLKVTPPIDKLSWQSGGGQVQVLVSAHDAQQQSRYYRWSLTETWEFNSAYMSQLEYYPSTKQIASRSTPIYTCWRTEQPSAIKQSSSAQLSQDAITDYSILSLSDHAERVKIRYSALVSQYVETVAEFNYYELLRKNTEAVGGVNDPLPTQLTGNIHRVDDAAEPVLGYVGAHTVQQKRIFIDRAALNFPQGWSFDSPYDACTIGTEYLCGPSGRCIPYPTTNVYSSPTAVPIDLVYDNAGKIAGYSGSSAACADCRTRGTNVKPSYW